MREVKLGLIQLRLSEEDTYLDKLDHMYSAAEACFAEGAQLVFLPESYQYQTDERDIISKPERLVQLSGEWKERCAALARKYNAYLAPWDYEYSTGRVYNTSFILDPSGREIGRYRKVHLTYTEKQRGISNGDSFPVFDTELGRIGIMICFDNYYPESARSLGNAGAELTLYPLYGDTLTAWEPKTRARAADSGMYIASSQIDIVHRQSFTGVFGPDGEVLYKLTEFPSHRVVMVNLGAPVVTHTMGRADVSEDLRKYLANLRRPRSYGGISVPPSQIPWEEVFLGEPPASL